MHLSCNDWQTYQGLSWYHAGNDCSCKACRWHALHLTSLIQTSYLQHVVELHPPAPLQGGAGLTRNGQADNAVQLAYSSQNQLNICC